MKEYNHALGNVLDACGFTHEEEDKCLDGAIALYNKCHCTSSFIEEVEKMITSGKFPTFTRFIIMEFTKSLRAMHDKALGDSVLKELKSLSKDYKIFSIDESDMPEELIKLIKEKEEEEKKASDKEGE